MVRFRMLSLCLPLVAALAASCSSTVASAPAPDAGGDCHLNPLQCAAGQVCWPVDRTPNFACIPSQAGAGFRSACEETIGSATCADGLACDTQNAATVGVCAYYCDDVKRPCPAGFACRATHVGGGSGPSIQICRPQGPPSGGDDGGPFLSDGGFDIGDATTDAGHSQQ